MHRSLDKGAPISRPVQRTGASSHMLSSVDCITTTSESEFTVHTAWGRAPLNQIGYWGHPAPTWIRSFRPDRGQYANEAPRRCASRSVSIHADGGIDIGVFSRTSS